MGLGRLYADSAFPHTMPPKNSAAASLNILGTVPAFTVPFDTWLHTEREREGGRERERDRTEASTRTHRLSDLYAARLVPDPSLCMYRSARPETGSRRSGSARPPRRRSSSDGWHKRGCGYLDRAPATKACSPTTSKHLVALRHVVVACHFEGAAARVKIPKHQVQGPSQGRLCGTCRCLAIMEQLFNYSYRSQIRREHLCPACVVLLR